MHPRPAPFRFQWLCTAFLLLALGACAGQGEGQRCDKLASSGGDSDCQSGLTCQARINSYSQSYGICCPQPPNQPTTTACSMSSGGLDASPTPTEASAEEASAVEVGADAPGEGSADAGSGSDGSDAPAE
jgi:hypothetical protein